MKIQSLKIHNIASIEDAYIEFDKPPLCTEPLFLISGPTGSGKTTILNAICLALYNEVPALKTIGSADDDKDGLKTNNTRQMLRRGTGEGEVVLTFTGNDSRHYRSTWRVQRAYKKASGKYQNLMRELHIIDDGTVVTRDSEIKELVHKAVGLTFQQFTRTTMLAQGQFASFMKAADNEKSEILEKLTGTDLYARIGMRVYQLYTQKRDEYTRLEVSCKTVIDSLLSDEQKAEMGRHLAELNTRIAEIETSARALNSQIQWLKNTQSAQAELQNARTHLARCTENAESQELKECAATVGIWDATTEIRAARTSARRTKSQVEQAGMQLRALSPAFAGFRAQLLRLKDLRMEVGERLRAAEEYTAAEQPYVRMYAASQQITVQSRNITRLQQRMAELAKQLEHNTILARKSKDEEVPLHTAVQKADERIREHSPKIDALSAQVADIDLPKLNESLNACNARIMHLQKCIDKIKNYHRCSAEHAEALRRLAELNAELSGAEAALTAATQKRPEYEHIYAEHKNLLEGQMLINDQINELRTLMAHEKECPLCGSRGASILPPEVLDSRLRQAKIRLQEALERLDKLNAEINAHTANIRQLRKTQKALDKELADKALLVQTDRDEASELCAAVDASGSPLDIDDDTITDTLGTLAHGLEQQRREIAERLKSDTQRQSQYTKALEELEVLRKALEKAVKAEKEKIEQTSALLAKAESMNAEMESTRIRIADTLAEIAALLSPDIVVSADNHSEISRRVAARAEKYRQNTELAAALTSKSELMQQRILTAETTIEELARRFGNAADAEPAQTDLDVEALLAFAAKVHACEANIDTLGRALLTIENEISAYHASEGSYSPAQVERAEAYSREDIEKMRQQVKAAEETLSNARQAVEIISAQLEKMMCEKPQMPDDATVDTLLQQSAALKADADEAVRLQASISAQLRLDEQKSAEVADKKAQLQTLRQERDLWQELDAAFGGADGKRFRLVAQSYVLMVLLRKANEYLVQLSGRYTLTCSDGSLSINVIDHHQADAERNVGSLSGGEGFIVSLALALGLSAISKDRINVDTLFIDEGFGTLSGEHLEMVLNALDRLHLTSGRKVGIISHVDSLKERITTQIRLESHGPASSRVSVVNG